MYRIVIIVAEMLGAMASKDGRQSLSLTIKMAVKEKLRMKNWKTAVCGIVAAAAQGVAAKFPQYAVICEIVSAAAVGALGFCAKDKDVTGGTIPQTAEAEVRVEVPEIITE